MMKKILALCLALLLAMSAALATPAADEAIDLVDLANEVISVLYPDVGQLYVYAREVQDGIYYFSAEGSDLAICPMPDEAGEHVNAVMVVCYAPEKLHLAMQTICALPFAYDDGDGMVLVADWFDGLFDDTLAAMESGEVFTASFADAATFSVDLIVAPMYAGNCLNIFFYVNSEFEASGESEATGESDGSGAA